MTFKLTDIYDEALTTFGYVAQEMMVFEEIGELMQAIGKYHRAKNCADMEIARMQLMGEIVDVDIMLTQLRKMVGMTKNEYLNIEMEKLGRLHEKIREAKAKKEGVKHD